MKNAKKIISFCLVVLMLFSVTSVAFAKDEVEQTCPLIYVPGFSSSPVYTDVNDESTLISFPGVEDILAAVADTILPALAVYAVDRDADKLAHSASVRINELFTSWFNEKTGETKKGSGIIEEELTDVDKTSKLTFAYDWRSDPMLIADSLNDYIEKVCALSGSDKVALGCHSLGSTVALAYLTKYGNDRITGIVFDSPACNGVKLIGNIFTGKVNVDGEGLAYFIKTYLGENEYKALIEGLIDIVETAGCLELLTLLADDVIEALAPVIYKETIIPLVGCWLPLWAMLPDEDVESAKAYFFDELLKDEDYSILQSKIDNYTNTVRANRTKTLKSFDEVGNFAIISRYNNQTIPLRGYSDFVGDLIIETHATSLGATTAPLGDYFCDDYLEGKDMAYISPDRTVDASTCLFPEKTWFIKNTGHFETGGLTVDYYDMFLYAEKELTCDTAELGRFSYLDRSTYTIVEDTTTPEKIEKPAVLKFIADFIKELIQKLSMILKPAQ